MVEDLTIDEAIAITEARIAKINRPADLLDDAEKIVAEEDEDEEDEKD